MKGWKMQQKRKGNAQLAVAQTFFHLEDLIGCERDQSSPSVPQQFAASEITRMSDEAQ